MPTAALDYDAVVIGSGNAGACAAFSAAESGCKKVLVVDVCPPEWAGGNGYFTAGAFRTVHGGLGDLLPVVRNVTAEQAATIDMDAYTDADFLGDIMRLGEGKPDPVLASAVVDASRDTIAWLAERVGIPFWFSFHRQAYGVGGRQKFWGGMVLCTEDGGKGLIKAHHDALKRVGVEMWFNSRAVEIVMKEGKVSGLVVEQDGKPVSIATRAVVLAAGGFESNPELRAKYLGEGWDRAIVSHVLLSVDWRISNLYSCEGLPTTDKSCSPALRLDFVDRDADAPLHGGNRELTNQYTKSGYPIGLMLNAHGLRFVDEGEGTDFPYYRNYTYAKFGRAILQQPGSFVFQIWDSKVIGMLRKEEYGDGVTNKIFADTVEDLAEKLEGKGLESKEGFLRTVLEFNDAVRGFQKENPSVEWNPAIKDGCATKDLRLPKSNWALTIDQPPFMAVKVSCGVTFTFGGLAIDPKTAGVISASTGEAIPGLFCTGEMVGLFHENYPGGSGLMAGAVFGRAAGRSAANVDAS
ncbi:FAD/NAD(P)-binding domain-containing protein [Mycena kentingensis (nom. inval.)]|nr:FAD/NAD(P)-binding domain-containing protein [Mycena kentingensis (nom. inval.)]